MAVYKISYVVTEGTHPGGIINLDHKPEIGDILTMGDQQFEIVELVELIPPRGEFYYLHATCKAIQKATET